MLDGVMLHISFIHVSVYFNCCTLETSLQLRHHVLPAGSADPIVLAHEDPLPNAHAQVRKERERGGVTSSHDIKSLILCAWSRGAIGSTG